MLLTKRLQETVYDLALAGLAGAGTGTIVSTWLMDGFDFETMAFCGLSFATYSTIDKWAKLHPRKKINKVSASVRGQGRAIPLGSGGHLFMSMVKSPFVSAEASSETISPEPTEYHVTYNGLPYTITRGELEEFLYTVWKRQRQNKPGLSRNFWTKTRRLQRELYEARIVVLETSGLIMDRGERRSGRLSLPPQLAIKAVNQALL